MSYVYFETPAMRPLLPESLRAGSGWVGSSLKLCTQVFVLTGCLAWKYGSVSFFTMAVNWCCGLLNGRLLCDILVPGCRLCGRTVNGLSRHCEFEAPEPHGQGTGLAFTCHISLVIAGLLEMDEIPRKMKVMKSRPPPRLPWCVIPSPGRWHDTPAASGRRLMGSDVPL